MTAYADKAYQEFGVFLLSTQVLSGWRSGLQFGREPFEWAGIAVCWLLARSMLAEPVYLVNDQMKDPCATRRRFSACVRLEAPIFCVDARRMAQIG